MTDRFSIKRVRRSLEGKAPSAKVHALLDAVTEMNGAIAAGDPPCPNYCRQLRELYRDVVGDFYSYFDHLPRRGAA